MSSEPINPAGLGLAICMSMVGVSAVAALVLPRQVRIVVAGFGTALAGAAAVGGGIAAMAGHRFAVSLPDLLPLSGLHLAIDPLGGVFVAVVGAVTVFAAIYGIGYTRHHLGGRGLQACVPLFAGAMVLVPVAASVGTFVLSWELMAITSLLLVIAEHTRGSAVREAGLWYGAMTQLGLVAILIGFVLFAADAPDDTFDSLRTATTSTAVGDVVFLLTLVGFASKAGAVPLHAWLPRAHPEAPSHVSALMSAAMVSLGVYGIVRVGFDLLGGGPRWWWLTVLTLGAVSALYGILQAAVSTDLKRLLGYSTTENMGLVLIGVGAAGIFNRAGLSVLAGLALAAGLLHVINHAAFKTLLFLAAGAVVHGTGSRDLDELGGLRPTMPVTTAAFAIGALAASALPPGNGFVSEWLLLQALIHGVTASGTTTAIVMPVAVAVIALTAGLAVATFVKAFGVGFLARPRSVAAARATEGSPAMRCGMVLATCACVALALAATTVGSGLTAAVGVAVSGSAPVVSGELTLRLSGLSGTVSPLLLAAALVTGVVAVWAVPRWFGVRRARRRARLWDCGAGPLSPRMEYTATSFAEPLQRVFDDVLQPELDVDVSHVQESRYLVDSVQYRRRVPDRIERRLYNPVLAVAGAWGRAGRRLATGSVHRYLGYGFSSLVALLVVLAVTR
jgi:hydrogenase-4 component B